MPNLAEKILKVVERKDGLTDREITNLLFGHTTGPQQVNAECRLLAAKGIIKRVHRDIDGLIGNFIGTPVQHANNLKTNEKNKSLESGTEDFIKAKIQSWLQRDGWTVDVKWGKERGIDILANRGKEKWIIEAKGIGSYQPMRVNYFLGALAELLQRMDDPSSSYSIAIPDHPQYRALWKRLPSLAKNRTTISALFVSETGQVSQTE